MIQNVAMDIFCYYISHKGNLVSEESDVWQSFLPTNRHLDTKPDDTFQSTVTCGDYFSAVSEFLSSDNFQIVIQAVGAGFEKTIQPQDLDKIHVILIKHGEFYHPAKIEVEIISKDQFDFVLNVAVSENGKILIAEEYTNLNSFDLLFPYSFLPKTYFMGGIPITENDELPMFLAEWCRGHHEFHWTKIPDRDELGIVVWDDENGNYFLNQNQTVTLFGQIAMILTSYYNFSSSYHISMWHHAAGDFIVCKENDNISVKLISVRKYVPLIDMDKPDLWTVLETLFVYFVSLSIRMRLDRIDGVGETVWGNELAVMGAVEGFLLGLQHQVANESIEPELYDGIVMYLKTFSHNNILEWCTTIARQIYQNSPDLDLILSHMDSHSEQLHRYIAHYLSDN